MILPTCQDGGACKMLFRRYISCKLSFKEVLIMEKRSNINWILSELPELCEKGILPAETAEVMGNYYREKLSVIPSPQKIFSLVIGIIGIVMVAGGIILFFNYNWDMFPKFLRIGISAIPLALGVGVSYFTICREKGQIFKECSAVLTSVGTAVLIAMLSQIYQLNGELHEFMFLVLLLAVPVLYIFNSIGLATLYVFFSFFVNHWNAPCWWKGILVLAFLPFLFFHLREKSSFCVWSRYLALALGVSLGFGCGKYAPLLAVITLSGLFLIAGFDLYRQKTAFFKNPWLIPAFVIQIIFLAVGSSTKDVFRLSRFCSSEDIWSFGICFSAVGIGVLIVLLRKRLIIERLLPVILILLTLIPFFTKEPVMCMIYNVYFGVAGVIYLYRGFVKRSLLIFNGGALMVSVLLACRFFDSDIGLLYRSLGFILLGIGFIAANVIYNRRNREE